MQQRGFTLIEVLVSIVILAVGLVGIAGLQAQSLRSSQDSYFRTQANTFANDLADRMRANATVATSSTLPYRQSSVAKFVGTEADIATTDLQALQSSLIASNLPLGDAVINGTSLGNGQAQYTITIRWDSQRNGAATADSGCDTNGIACFSTTIRISDEG